ncbi:MAG TPA: hypothetical protein VG146_18350 [Verrucomicrobiae bacterium]|nr:hypothetical protein [Verrucomicrobiae bacterium]
MNDKKSPERVRPVKRQNKTETVCDKGEASVEEFSLHESIYGVRYPKQVVVSSLASAPVLG